MHKSIHYLFVSRETHALEGESRRNAAAIRLARWATSKGYRVTFESSGPSGNAWLTIWKG
jgi:hypothetical protein